MKNVIAIDFGHGETAAAYPYQLMKNNAATFEVKRLAFKNNRAIVYSRIFISEDQMKALSEMENITYSELEKLENTLGDFLIGDFSKQINKSGETYNYFKIQPSMFDEKIKGALSDKYGITHGMVMACYAFQVVNDLLSSNPNDLMGYTRNSITLLIGCPTSPAWTSEKEANKFKKLVMDATGVKNVIIIPESRAAMFSSIQTSDNSKAVSADKGAVIFDFGSSTADCTYIWMGKKILEFSWRLGASEIEEILYNSVVKEYNNESSDDNKITDEQSIASSPECTKELRKAKEEFYATKNTIEPICNFSKTEDSTRKLLSVTLDEDKMYSITHTSPLSLVDEHNNLRSGSWYDLCKEFYEYAKEIITSAKVEDEFCPIGSVVITGGASKMPFVRELCKEVFPNCEYYVEDNPSYSVSNGLCWSQISEDKLDICLKRALERINNDPACKIEKLMDMISESLYESLREIIEEKSKEWASGETDLSIQDLINSISDFIKTQEVTEKFMHIIFSQEQEWKKICSTVINESVNAEAQELYCNNVPDYITNYSNKTLYDLNLDFDELIKTICSSLVFTIQKTIIKIVIYILAGVFAFVPGIGTIIMGILIFFADDIASGIPVANGQLSQTRSKHTREIISNRISRDTNRKQKEKIILDVKRSISENLNSGNDFDPEKFQEAIESITKRAMEILLLKFNNKENEYGE